MSDEEDFGTGLDQYEECENRGILTADALWEIMCNNEESFCAVLD